MYECTVLYVCMYVCMYIQYCMYVHDFLFDLQQQKGLMQVRVIGDWRIHHCSNCSTDVFVTHTVKSERILISSNLVSLTKIDRLAVCLES